MECHGGNIIFKYQWSLSQAPTTFGKSSGYFYHLKIMIKIFIYTIKLYVFYARLTEGCGNSRMISDGLTEGCRELAKDSVNI